jgi:MoxR-like ATPase
VTPAAAAQALRTALVDAARGLVEREVLVDVILLAAVAEEHVLVVGPPGTAKSEAVRRVAKAVGGRYFEYLLGRFTEPSEIFGPIDLNKLRSGVIETRTDGMLPDAEVAFLDEVFLASTAILNTLLGILNERAFRRGHTQLKCPLRVCVGASNRLPEDESLAAFADRFLVRVFVEPIADPLLEDLLDGGWSLVSSARLAGTPRPSLLEALDVVGAAARGSDLGAIRPELAQALRLLRKNGVNLSDRRAVKLQSLIAAAAALDGRARAERADLWPIVFAVPTREEQAIAREVLRELLLASQNSALGAAALEASAGPHARAQRILRAGSELFEAKPDGGDSLSGWKLRLEGIGREIDAGFVADDLPDDLRALRARIVSELA